ncbi:hypothetical protein Leryth_005558 [Lithospermum erythrorhizon]|nr:hypothetical protein Leryth_005558 [Lithospermum erythrorhizon]
MTSTNHHQLPHSSSEPPLPPPPPPFSAASISLSYPPSSPPPNPPPPPQPTPISILKLKKIPAQIPKLNISYSNFLHFIKNRFLFHKPIKLIFLKSTFSPTPLQSPFITNPLRPSEPSNGVVTRGASIVWFRNDLRVVDNECLTNATNESMSVLPVYCFDPRDYGKSSSGFDKTGPYRASFVVESVENLRRNLQARGSDLVVRIGKPEVVLVELAKAVGAGAVYAHREVSNDEVKAEEKIEGVMKEEGIEVKYFWGSTLYHLDDLPFKLEDMPTTYGGFKEKVKGLEVRKTIEALDQLKGLPSRGDVEPGEIPTLVDLGLNPSATMGKNGKSAANASLVGGETEALQRGSGCC